MRKMVLIGGITGLAAALLLLFMVLGYGVGDRTDALADMCLLRDRGLGGVGGVAQTAEGTLVTGATYDMPGGWAVFLDRDGKERWSLAEKECGYLHPTALPGGGFAVVRQQADDSLSMIVFDENGQVTVNRPLSLYTRDMLAAGDSIFVLGNQAILDEESGYTVEGLPYLERLDSEARPRWLLTYPHGDAHRRFLKAVFATDSLLIAGDAELEEPDSGSGVLYRVDLDGNVLWDHVFAPELDDESHILDICVNEDGIIAAIVADYGYDEDYGYHVNRLCGVYGLNMDGEVLWYHALNDGEYQIGRIMDGVMANAILPVHGGFLCGGYKILREDSGILNMEWLLLLDGEGNVRADSTPEIMSDRVEVSGMVGGAGGKALLYGANIEGVEILEGWEEGDIPGRPFFATLDFPEAYQ